MTQKDSRSNSKKIKEPNNKVAKTATKGDRVKNQI